MVSLFFHFPELSLVTLRDHLEGWGWPVLLTLVCGERCLELLPSGAPVPTCRADATSVCLLSGFFILPAPQGCDDGVK